MSMQFLRILIGFKLTTLLITQLLTRAAHHLDLTLKIRISSNKVVTLVVGIVSKHAKLLFDRIGSTFLVLIVDLVVFSVQLSFILIGSTSYLHMHSLQLDEVAVGLLCDCGGCA